MHTYVFFVYLNDFIIQTNIAFCLHFLPVLWKDESNISWWQLLFPLFLFPTYLFIIYDKFCVAWPAASCECLLLNLYWCVCEWSWTRTCVCVLLDPYRCVWVRSWNNSGVRVCVLLDPLMCACVCDAGPTQVCVCVAGPAPAFRSHTQAIPPLYINTSSL